MQRRRPSRKRRLRPSSRRQAGGTPRRIGAAQRDDVAIDRRHGRRREPACSRPHRQRRGSGAPRRRMRRGASPSPVRPRHTRRAARCARGHRASPRRRRGRASAGALCTRSAVARPTLTASKARAGTPPSTTRQCGASRPCAFFMAASSPHAIPSSRWGGIVAGRGNTQRAACTAQRWSLARAPPLGRSLWSGCPLPVVSRSAARAAVRFYVMLSAASCSMGCPNTRDSSSSHAFLVLAALPARGRGSTSRQPSPWAGRAASAARIAAARSLPATF